MAIGLFHARTLRELEQSFPAPRAKSTSRWDRHPEILNRLLGTIQKWNKLIPSADGADSDTDLLN